ncbi:MAG: hypothetical protein ACJ8KA_00475, partial [Sulfurifustis sp.]
MKDEKTGTLTLPADNADAARYGQPASAIDRWLADKALSLVGNPSVALVLWDGDEVRLPGATPTRRAYIRDRAAF